MIDWFTTTIASHTRRASPVTTLSLRTLGPQRRRRLLGTPMASVTRQAEQAGCSRQTLYNHAREKSSNACNRPLPQHAAGPRGPLLRPQHPTARANPPLRRLAVTAFAMGFSTRQIEDAARRPHRRPTPPTTRRSRRWVADEAREGQAGPQGARRGVRAGWSGPWPSDEVFFGGRPTLVGIEPA